MQNFLGLALTVRSDHAGLRVGNSKVKNAVLNRTEITDAGLVKDHRRRTGHVTSDHKFRVFLSGRDGKPVSVFPVVERSGVYQRGIDQTTGWRLPVIARGRFQFLQFGQTTGKSGCRKGRRVSRLGLIDGPNGSDRRAFISGYAGTEKIGKGNRSDQAHKRHRDQQFCKSETEICCTRMWDMGKHQHLTSMIPQYAKPQASNIEGATAVSRREETSLLWEERNQEEGPFE